MAQESAMYRVRVEDYGMGEQYWLVEHRENGWADGPWKMRCGHLTQDGAIACLNDGRRSTHDEIVDANG